MAPAEKTVDQAREDVAIIRAHTMWKMVEEVAVDLEDVDEIDNINYFTQKGSSIHHHHHDDEIDNNNE